MIGRRICTALAVTLVSMLVLPAIGGSSLAGDWSSKVDGRVLRDTGRGGRADLLVLLTSQPDLSQAALLRSKDAKGSLVFDALRTNARRSQAPIRAVLDARAVAYRSHFIVNLIMVRGADRGLVQTLASRSDVRLIDANTRVGSTALPTGPPVLSPASPETIEWGVNKVRAPQVWARGFTGQGVVVGDIDTGFQWDHPALKGHYRGWNGSVANHNYNWYDETDPTNRSPLDPGGHGTHTLGTIIGDDGGTNQIGVAPGAKWIGCRAMDAGGLGTPDTYIGCLEFMLAPWDLDGNNPDPAKAPMVISNSWHCSISLGECPNQGILFTAVHNLRLAGILPVNSTGNEGPTCATVGIDGPPAQYDDTFSVGATTEQNTLASFSSRGPATFQGTRIKPDIVAPGQLVRSSYPTNTYAVLSGTSMAAPHIAGVVALIYSAKPSLIGDPDATEQLIEGTAQHVSSSECSSSGSFPNNLYGWGLANAARAVRR